MSRVLARSLASLLPIKNRLLHQPCFSVVMGQEFGLRLSHVGERLIENIRGASMEFAPSFTWRWAISFSLPLGANVLPDGLTDYPKPFAGYDDVLGTYAAWLVSQRVKGWTVLDLHTAMKQAIAGKRQTQPGWTAYGELGLGYDSNITGVPSNFFSASFTSSLS